MLFLVWELLGTNFRLNSSWGIYHVSRVKPIAIFVAWTSLTVAQSFQLYLKIRSGFSSATFYHIRSKDKFSRYFSCSWCWSPSSRNLDRCKWQHCEFSERCTEEEEKKFFKKKLTLASYHVLRFQNSLTIVKSQNFDRDHVSLAKILHSNFSRGATWRQKPFLIPWHHAQKLIKRYGYQVFPSASARECHLCSSLGLISALRWAHALSSPDEF